MVRLDIHSSWFFFRLSHFNNRQNICTMLLIERRANLTASINYHMISIISTKIKYAGQAFRFDSRETNFLKIFSADKTDTA